MCQDSTGQRRFAMQLAVNHVAAEVRRTMDPGAVYIHAYMHTYIHIYIYIYTCIQAYSIRAYMLRKCRQH